MARANLGSSSAVRMLEMRLTLWLSSTIFPEIGMTPSLATSTIFPVLASLPENCRLKCDIILRQNFKGNMQEERDNYIKGHIRLLFSYLAPRMLSSMEPRRPPRPPTRMTSPWLGAALMWCGAAEKRTPR